MKTLNFKKFFWLVSLVAVFFFQFALAETNIPGKLSPIGR